jgi:hypothetical protein
VNPRAPRYSNAEKTAFMASTARWWLIAEDAQQVYGKVLPVNATGDWSDCLRADCRGASCAGSA